MAVEVSGTLPQIDEVSKLSHHAQSLLKMARDTEFLQSFLRVDLGHDSDPEDTKSHNLKSALKKPSDDTPHAAKASGRHDKAGAGTSSTDKQPHRDGDVTPRATAKTTFSQLTRDMKLTKKSRKKRGKETRQDFLYTDRDRASTVDMGSRDIKRDIKDKQRMDRSRALQIPDEADPGTLLALGNYEMRSGNVNIAINFIHKVAIQLSNAKQYNTTIANRITTF